MFLQKLYQQHKGWFFFVLLFILGQLFINYKHGVVFSPFYHYGMFSGVAKTEKNFDVMEIKVNGKLLQTKDFTPQVWDKIMLPLSMNNQQQQWNSNVYNNTIKRLFHTKDSSVYVNHYSQEQFNDWYKSYLQNIIFQKIDSINVSMKTVAF